LGNLVYRTLTMIEKYFQGKVPDGKTKNGKAMAIREKIELLPELVGGFLAVNSDFSSALEKIWELINMANKYIEDTKPWNLAKENQQDELKGFICLLVDVIRSVAGNIAPFIPQTAASIQEQLGEREIKKGKPLFPRLPVGRQA